MKTIIFSRKGQAISDFEVESSCKAFIESQSNEWEVSNSVIINYFRAAIKHKEIKKGDYLFLVENYNGVLLPFIVDERGYSNNWQDSQDVGLKILMRLL